MIGTAGANVSNSCFIGNIRGVTTSISNAIPVLIDSAGQLGTDELFAAVQKGNQTDGTSQRSDSGA